ncbi:prephenate dehydratase [Candidatus Omnitrophota bacterium]
MKLKNLRHQINKLDKSIVGLLNQRAGITRKIGTLKRGSGGGVYSPDREQDVLKRISCQNRGPLTSDGLKAIYREVMSCSLSADKNLRLAYLGPEATFTHLAALKRFGSQVEYMACKNISDVFLKVARDNADYGVVPIENTIEGVVSHTLDMFIDSDLKICAQIILDVSHNLMANCSKNSIKRVYSNPHVFGQCRLWLQENLPCAELIEVSSTTRAAQIAAKTKAAACIGSSLAARVYKLKIIARGIEDSPHNITRFLVIAKIDVPATGDDRTSVMFSIKDRVGALHDMLLPFKRNKINLTKIESRPSKKKAWDYYFYVDFKGHKDNPRVRIALSQLESKCKFLKVLGSYPMGE